MQQERFEFLSVGDRLVGNFYDDPALIILWPTLWRVLFARVAARPSG